ncbi:Hypothetical_protein [Hexamita inflata]|uniref:Hypothetical_protein n=1 Tax=Hexamita inflata TaxID=28002 RepID=A0AA86PMB0_9EUKA|nr:Hypothetical protein HINF_LOCUS28886 [Hexamita inflata]
MQQNLIFELEKQLKTNGPDKIEQLNLELLALRNYKRNDLNLGEQVDELKVQVNALKLSLEQQKQLTVAKSREILDIKSIYSSQATQSTSGVCPMDQIHLDQIYALKQTIANQRHDMQQLNITITMLEEQIKQQDNKLQLSSAKLQKALAEQIKEAELRRKTLNQNTELKEKLQKMVRLDAEFGVYSPRSRK